MSQRDKERRKLLEKELKRIVLKLKKDYRPEKIILFGSLAERKVREGSDLDLVIIKETKKRFLDRLKEVALTTRPKVGVDFLVYTPSEFEKIKKRENYFILDEVIKKGKVVYG